MHCRPADCSDRYGTDPGCKSILDIVTVAIPYPSDLLDLRGTAVEALRADLGFGGGRAHDASTDIECPKNCSQTAVIDRLAELFNVLLVERSTFLAF